MIVPAVVEVRLINQDVAKPTSSVVFLLELFMSMKNIYSVSKTLIGLARNETNDELLFPRLDFFSRDQREVSCLAEAYGLG